MVIEIENQILVILDRRNCIIKNISNIWYLLVIFGKKSEFFKLASLQNSSQFDALYAYFFPQIQTTL